MQRPVLLVHGIWHDGRKFQTLKRALQRADVGPVHTVDLSPNDGSASIEELADQVHQAAKSAAGDRQIDVVGFSMGALVTRYWVQRGQGRHKVRRFVSISGPHSGTATAHLQRKAGVRQMRPNSDLLSELDRDEDPWGEVQVHTMWTPYDLMIVPPRSGQLRNVASEVKLPIALHRWMISDKRAVNTVVGLLKAA